MLIISKYVHLNKPCLHNWELQTPINISIGYRWIHFTKPVWPPSSINSFWLLNLRLQKICSLIKPLTDHHYLWTVTFKMYWAWPQSGRYLLPLLLYTEIVVDESLVKFPDYCLGVSAGHPVYVYVYVLSLRFSGSQTVRGGGWGVYSSHTM